MGFSGNDTQYEGQAGGHRHEFGKLSFTTTDLTKTITTRLTKILVFKADLLVTTGQLAEHLYCPCTISNGMFTVTREVKPIRLSGASDDAVHVSGNNWADIPIGYCEYAGTLLKVVFFEKTTEGGGAATILIGNIIADGTKDVDAHTDAGDAQTPAGSGKYKVITTFTGAETNVIAAGHLLIAGTASGGTSAPSGAHVEAIYRPDPTSAVTFSYDVWGY